MSWTMCLRAIPEFPGYFAAIDGSIWSQRQSSVLLDVGTDAGSADPVIQFLHLAQARIFDRGQHAAASVVRLLALWTQFDRVGSARKKAPAFPHARACDHDCYLAALYPGRVN